MGRNMLSNMAFSNSVEPVIIRRYAHAAVNEVGIVTLLLLLAMMKGAADGESKSIVKASEAEDALSVCRQLMKTSSPSFASFNFATGSYGEDWGLFDSRSPKFTLKNALRFHPIATVNETSHTITLCVGLIDTTTYTHISEEESPIAWITLHTDRDKAVGLVHVNTDCWRDQKNLAGCSPSYIPLQYIEKLPQYHYSILEKEHWSNFTTSGMEISPTWVWKINTNTRTDKEFIRPSWLYKMDIQSLERLEIVGNDWIKPENLLGHLPNIKKLDISYNNLQAVPKDMLREMPHLEDLILGHNNISEFPSEVSTLKLRLLDLTNPLGDAVLKITDENVEKLPRTLQILGLENTHLESNVTKILLLPQLKFLNLSGCALKEMPDYYFENGSEINVSSELIMMDISYNQLVSLPLAVFQKLTKLRNLKLHHNDLTVWPVNLGMGGTLVELSLSNNHIGQITNETFLYFPELSILDLSWNIIEHIADESFSNNRKLEQLDLSHNNLSHIPNNLFSSLQKLKEIKISNNFLKSFPTLFYMDLKVLDLSRNFLTEFKNDNTSIQFVDLSYNSVSNLLIMHVEKLNISYNKISFISPPMWQNIQTLKTIDLGGNNFECCLFGNNMFLKNNVYTDVMNLGTFEPLTCTVNKTSPKILLQTFVFNGTECSLPELSESSSRLEIYLPLGILFVAVCLVTSILYVYRYELTYLSHLFQMKKVGNISDEERYETCTYDAFVCYSAKNFAWVAGRLLPALERPPHAYRLCVHDRDFTLGAAIHRNIIASLEKSRKVILVLSQDFVASKWCQWELEMANHKMFEEKRNSIVLVELERLERRRLPRHLRYLMARTTYLQWPTQGDAWVELQEEINGAFEGGGEVGTKQVKGMAEDEGRRQRRLQRENTCLRRLREALGVSLSQRNGDNAMPPPCSVLDSS